MSGYPPASSYGPPPGLTSLNGSYQPQQPNNQQHYQQYDYSNHNSDPNVSAFSNNSAYQGGYQNQVPPFSASAVASGVPPLPIFPQWQMNNDPQQQSYANTAWGPPLSHQHEPLYPYQQQHQQQYQPQQPQHMHFDQHGQAPYNPYTAAGVSFPDASFNATSRPSPMAYTPQPILHAQSQPPQGGPPSKPQQQVFAPPTGPKPRPPPDEGEVSEGEYVPTPKRLPPREKTFSRERKSWARENGDRNGRQPSNDHYSPTQHFPRPDVSRRSSRESPVRGLRGFGDLEHKSKGTGVKARKEAARETTRQATRKSTPPDSRNLSLAGPPAIEQLPLPKSPAQVPQALQHARAKAQNAVLNLISLKVRFQDYLDEGIDEKVLTKVFADVGLNPGIRDAPKVNGKPISKPALAPAPQTTVLPGLSAIPPPPPPTTKVALPEKPVAALPPPKEDNGLGLGNRKPASISAASAGNKAEERKDRIARLMALKSGAKVEKPAEPIAETAPPPPEPVVVHVAPSAPIDPVCEEPVKKPVPSPAPMQYPLPPKPKAAEASQPNAPEANIVTTAAPVEIGTNAILRQRTEALQARQPVVDKTALLKKKMEEMEAKAKQNQADKAAKEAAEKAAKDANLRKRIAALNARNSGQEESANHFAAQQPMKTDPAENFLADMFPADMPSFNPFAEVSQSGFPPGMPSFPPPNGMPAIPGLFLGEQPAQPSPQLTMAASAAPVNIRKRPVASDFDNSGASTPPVFKKPFGHMDGPDKLILDVSESEDGEASEDDDGMNLDEVIDQYGRQANLPRKPSMRDLPPLSDFPPRRSYTAPSSAVSTPPVSQSMHRPAARPEDLKSKESAIAEMRRKIAEAEERRKAKLAAAGTSNLASKTPDPPVASASVDRIETSNQIERLLSEANRKIEEDQQKLAAAQMLQEQKAVDVDKAQEEQRRKRQAELAANPPAVDADLQESQRRLEELRAEMQKIEAGMQKKLDDQKRLAETMEKLNAEADQQLEAQKEQLKEINNDIAEADHERGDAIEHSESAEVDVPVATEYALANEATENQKRSASEFGGHSHQDVSAIGKSSASIEQAEPAADTAPEDAANGVEKNESSDDLYDEAPKSIMNGCLAKSTEDEEVEMSSSSESTPMVESSESDRSSKSQERETPAQERGSSSDSSDQSMDESSSAEMDIDEPDAELSARAEEAQVQESSSSESSSSSSDESDSSEDDSDDDDSPAPKNDDVQDEEMPDVSDTSSSGSSATSDSESDEAEDEPPATASPPAPVATVASVARSASNSLAPETISRPAASSPAVSTPRIIEDPPALAAVEPAQRRLAPATSAEIVKANTTHRASPRDSAKPVETAKKSHFTPYESPLKSLHSYRFHPQFTKEVPGGYRSATYSNNIRENDDFCRYELQGGLCNDEKCLDQHFREAGISDQAVLEILSNSKGLDKEEKMKWITGLKQVLGELRAKNVSNFEGIAQGIVEFRRKFFEERGTIVPPDTSHSASTLA